MVKECADKAGTRRLYEDSFDDPTVFVDYYYSDKCLDNRIIVSKEQGEVVSMLHLNPYCINLCGAVVKSYYIVAVATRADWRRKGQMARVFEKTFEILRKEQVPFVYLMPVDEAIYSWMGFEKICDFVLDRCKSFDEVRSNYDIYCMWDEAYIRRMKKEEELRSLDMGEVLPENPVIMGKITDLEAFSAAAGRTFADEKEALNWMRSKKIYICEEV